MPRNRAGLVQLHQRGREHALANEVHAQALAFVWTNHLSRVDVHRIISHTPADSAQDARRACYRWDGMTPDGTLRHSRRNILTAAAAAVAGAVASTLAGAQAVLGVANDDGKVIHVGDTYQHARATTQLQSVVEYQTVLYASAGYGGSALAGSSDHGQGVEGLSHSGSAVYGSSLSGGGVFGVSESGVGAAGSSTSGYGMHAQSDSNMGIYTQSGSSYGVFSQGGSASLPSILGWAYGNAAGVQGYSGPTLPAAPPNHTGVHGYADQDATAVGVNGQSPKGRGVVASGGAAQLRLVPSSATTHPTSGAVGDLFLDKSARLWLCTTTGSPATWKQVA
jgi:hypothetical protein